ncbi:MAG: RHS repeat-associated core domain-containing protein, partial [Sedimentibacter sp.]
TNYSYDTQNLTTTVTDGENKKIQYTYNPSNNVVQVTENPLDPTNMAVTTYAYDNYNNLTKVIAPNTNKVDGTDAYVYSYDVNGNITQVQLPENQSASVSYDSQNNPIENIDFNGNKSNYSYDSDSNQLESTDANIQTSANRYWSNGNLWYSTNIMSAADNLITNSSMELDSNSDSWPDNWTKITESGKTATYAWSGTAKYGNKSISISNPTGWAVASSDYIPATVNDKFIVSGYVKTSNITGSSLIKVDFYNSSDVWIGQKASYELKGTHDWTRVQAVTDNIPAGTAKIRVSVGMNAGTGTVYFDGMQLEKGTVLSSYNLIDNSSFERTTNNLPDNWTTSGNFTSNDIIDTSERHIGANSMKITGESGKNKFITQHINISGDSNTKLTLSGWSKQVGSNETGSYLMQVAIHYTNGTTDWLGNNFSRVEDGWQHVAAKIEPTSTFDWIEVYYSYYDQTGTAWFDAARLEVGSSHTFNNYDVYNNYVTSVNDPMGNVSSFTYDAFGNILTAEDPKKQTTAYSYDNRNLLTKVTDAKNGITTYGYDNAGNRTAVTDARTKVTTYDYNEFNLVSKITNPLNQITQFGYNKNGQNTKTIFPKGDTITSTYNALNRLNGISYNGVQKWGYEYDANGNVTKINNIAAGSSTTNTYDKNDRITQVTEGANNRFDYGYDDNSSLTSLTLTAGTASNVFGYSYDSLNQMTSLSRNSQNLAKFVYDERGNITSERFSNGTYTSYEYDGNNRLTAIKNYNAAGSVLNSYSYTYDANGNRISVITPSGTINYQYDELNRLTQETLLDGTIISYEYDAVGNRTKKTAGSTVTNYTYDNGNQLTNVNGQAYTYDANGNLTSNGSKTFVYNEVNQLTQVKDSLGNVIASYAYDDQGRRISLTAWGETSKFHYSGDKVIYTTNGSNNIIAEFSYDSYGNPATMTYNGATYYYHIDGHGNVTAMTDASGNTVAQYSYDAWGKILSQSGSMAAINPFRYAGYRYDEATGLYYLMARYYDPGVGRFISRDTFHGFEDEPLSLNQYAYCNNNPVMYVDPSGHIPNGWWNSTINIGRVIDAAIIVFAAGQTIYGKYAAKAFLKKNKAKVISATRGKLMRFFPSVKSTVVTAAVNAALTLVGSSVGQLVANGFDYIDSWWGYPRSNGYIFG